MKSIDFIILSFILLIFIGGYLVDGTKGLGATMVAVGIIGGMLVPPYMDFYRKM